MARKEVLNTTKPPEAKKGPKVTLTALGYVFARMFDTPPVLEKFFREKEEKINALTETFQRLGWDERIPREINGWGVFECTGQDFSLSISRGGCENFITRIEVHVASGDQAEEELVPSFRLFYGWGNGENLEIKACPVEKIALFPAGQGISFGDFSLPRLLVKAPWDKLTTVIDRHGEIWVPRPGFEETF